jgi:hypothetical protein
VQHRHGRASRSGGATRSLPPRGRRPALSLLRRLAARPARVSLTSCASQNVRPGREPAAARSRTSGARPGRVACGATLTAAQHSVDDVRGLRNDARRGAAIVAPGGDCRARPVRHDETTRVRRMGIQIHGFQPRAASLGGNFQRASQQLAALGDDLGETGRALRLRTRTRTSRWCGRTALGQARSARSTRCRELSAAPLWPVFSRSTRGVAVQARDIRAVCYGWPGQAAVSVTLGACPVSTPQPSAAADPPTPSGPGVAAPRRSGRSSSLRPVGRTR